MGLGYVKIFDDGGVRLFIQQADDKDRQRRNDEAGHDLVDAGRGKKFFPDEDGAAAAENAGDSALDSGAAPEKAEQYERPEGSTEAGPGVGDQFQNIVVGIRGQR